MGYRLLMLGPPALIHGNDVVALKSRKGQALLWYLAANPETMFSREHLHGLLWDEIPADSARRDFNTMLSRFRDEIPFDAFRARRGHLGWNPDAAVTTDLAEFWHLLRQAGIGPDLTQARPPTAAREKDALHRAIALWRGPFLDGFSCDSASYQEWMVAERHRWELRVLAALDALVEAERSDERWAQVLNLARRALEIDPLQETFHRAAMEALFRMGNRAAALAQFEQCRKLLREQLGALPDDATAAMAESIRRSTLPGKSPSGVTLSHFEEPTPTRKLPSARITPSRFESAVAHWMPPLVGRKREYTLITEALRRTARDGLRHAVLLHGEAGIGKTRLLAEIIDAAARGEPSDGVFPTLLLGRAYESMESVPYSVFVEALQPAFAAIDAPDAYLPDVWLRELGRLLPDVFVRRPDLAQPEPMESGDDRLRLFQAVLRFLSGLPQPVLLVIDDLQWADPLTVSLLDYLLCYPASHLSLAVLVAVRDGDDSDSLRRVLNALERDKRLTRIGLPNLTREDTFELVRRLSPAGGPAQAGQIYSQTHGHPLHTVELVNMLLEEGTGDDPTQAGGKNIAAGETAPLPVPRTVQEVFVGRLNRLGEKAAEVADALAVFGRSATVDQLQQATGLSEAELVGAVAALSRAYIISEGSLGDVSFRHDVFRQVVLERMPIARLMHLHRQAYAVLAGTRTPGASTSEGFPVEGIDLQLLADLVAHSVGGQLWEAALHWTQQAAAVAQRLHAFSAAVEYLKTAQRCLERLPASETRHQRRIEIELQMVTIDPSAPPGDRDARLAALARFAKEQGMASYIPRIHMAQADSLILQGRCLEAAPLLEALTPLAAYDRRFSAGLNAWKGAINAITGNLHQAIRHFIAAREAMGEEVMKPGTSVNGGLAACYAAAGEFDRADAALAEMEHEERVQGYQYLTSKYLTIAATVEYWRGDWEKAASYARRGLVTSRAAEDAVNEAFCSLWLGAALVELASSAEAHLFAGDGTTVFREREKAAQGSEEEAALRGEIGPQAVAGGKPRKSAGFEEPGTAQKVCREELLREAVGALEAALAASLRSQSYNRRDYIYTFLALAYAQAGQTEKAEEAVDAGLSISRRFGFKEGEALGTEAKGRIAASAGDLQGARRHLCDALALFESLGNVAGARRCRQRLAALEGTAPHSGKF